MFYTPLSSSLYARLTLAFSLLVVTANLISLYMIPVPFLSLAIPAGLFLYPLTFILSDVITEIYGSEHARKTVYIALGLNLVSLIAMEIFLSLSTLFAQKPLEINDVIHLSSLRIFASLTAYVISQLTAIQVYQWLKKLTGEHYLWLRNNGSTCVSQLVDTLLIDLIFLYWGLGMTFTQVCPIIVFSYGYKTVFSFSATPLFYACVAWIRKNQAWKTASSR